MAQESLEQEISWLQEQLESKKRELKEHGGEQKEEREMIKEIIREAPLAAPLPPPPAGGHPPLSDDAAQKAADELKEKSHEEAIESLARVAFAKNLLAALKIARSLKNPHFLDEFHDALADRYYDKLIEARKINP